MYVCSGMGVSSIRDGNPVGRVVQWSSGELSEDTPTENV